MHDVLDIMGVPSGILGDTFNYAYSTVSFSNNIVCGYHDISHNLLIANKYQPSVPRKGHFAIGASKKEVMDVMGAPTGVYGDVWDYEFSSITFVNDLVGSYSDIGHNLNI
jgi:hypothetical protein